VVFHTRRNPAAVTIAVLTLLVLAIAFGVEVGWLCRC
jgi:hypothetical protein